MTEPNREAVNEAIAVLNRIHAADPTVLPALMSYRVRCNEAVADDPSVQVKVVPADQLGKEDGYFEVGLLGIINGIFGVDARSVGFIGAYYDDDHNLTHFDWTVAEGNQ